MGNWHVWVDIWIHVKHGLTWTFQGLYRLFQQECLSYTTCWCGSRSLRAAPLSRQNYRTLKFIKTIVFQNLHSLNVATKTKKTKNYIPVFV